MNAPIENIVLQDKQVQNVIGTKTIEDEVQTSVQDILEKSDGTNIANHLHYEIGKKSITFKLADRYILQRTKEYIYDYQLIDENGVLSTTEIRFQPYNNTYCIIVLKGKEYSISNTHPIIKEICEGNKLPIYTETKEGGVRLIGI